MKYRKKPILIDAWPLALDSSRHMPPWVLEAMNRGHVWLDPNGQGFVVGTPEGEMRADFGDMLIKGVVNELYPCKKAIFDASYESVPE